MPAALAAQPSLVAPALVTARPSLVTSGLVTVCLISQVGRDGRGGKGGRGVSLEPPGAEGALPRRMRGVGGSGQVRHCVIAAASVAAVHEPPHADPLRRR